MIPWIQSFDTCGSLPETIDPPFSVHVHIVFTLCEHTLVISEISIQQTRDPMSEENNLALEEMEEIEAAPMDE